MKLLAVALLTASTFAPAQSPLTPLFSLTNPKNVKIDISDANHLYVQATEEVMAEYHVSEVLRPQFTLILGADKDSVQWNQGKGWEGGEIRLRKFDRRLFRQGVVALSLNELVKMENVMRVERRLEDVENATIDVHALRH